MPTGSHGGPRTRGGPVAAGERAPAVPCGHRAAQRGGDGALGAADVEGLPLAAEDDGHHAGVAGQHPQVGGAERAAEVEQRSAGAGFELLQGDGDGQVRALATAVGDRAVVEAVAGDLAQRVGLALRQAAVLTC